MSTSHAAAVPRPRRNVNPGADALVVVDFDRTLCSTRAGADPTKGEGRKKPVADEALSELLAATPAGRAVVLTRNSHREGIRAFLDARSLDHVVVRSAKREGRSKADVLAELLADPGQRAVFADDDVFELVDAGVEELAKRGQLVRVLFCPGPAGLN